MHPVTLNRTTNYFSKPDCSGDTFFFPGLSWSIKKIVSESRRKHLIKLTEPCFPNQHKQI